jgi:hypothetical protein
MTSLNPIPADRHVGLQITIPYGDLYRAMCGFLGDLDRAEADYRVEVSALRAKLGVAASYLETPEVERYSLAVQLFAAMTVDALVSFFVILRFGGAHHDDHSRWPPTDQRLRKALDHVGVPISDDAEVLGLIRKLMEARHRIAHPHSVELLGSEQAAIEIPDRRGPDYTAVAAREAVAIVNRVFEILRDLDPDHAHFLTTF